MWGDDIFCCPGFRRLLMDVSRTFVCTRIGDRCVAVGLLVEDGCFPLGSSCLACWEPWALADLEEYVSFLNSPVTSFFVASCPRTGVFETSDIALWIVDRTRFRGVTLTLLPPGARKLLTSTASVFRDVKAHLGSSCIVSKALVISEGLCNEFCGGKYESLFAVYCADDPAIDLTSRACGRLGWLSDFT